METKDLGHLVRTLVGEVGSEDVGGEGPFGSPLTGCRTIR